jgi:hypothetical protein
MSDECRSGPRSGGHGCNVFAARASAAALVVPVLKPSPSWHPLTGARRVETSRLAKNFLSTPIGNEIGPPGLSERHAASGERKIKTAAGFLRTAGAHCVGRPLGQSSSSNQMHAASPPQVAITPPSKVDVVHGVHPTSKSDCQFPLV